jgi:TolA-binding protein
VAILAIVPSGKSTAAESFRHAGTEFNALRSVTVPAGKGYTIAVAEFFHHGEIRSDGSNVLVIAKNSKELVPMRVLQVGPGDFCRVAFQTIRSQAEYELLYGGDPPKESPPAWTRHDGLLLETRQFKRCDFNSFEAVRKAFESATPIGADYVESVFHAANPFTLKREPFLSRYSGQLHLTKSGTYGLYTSSQDCSFLLIDGKLAASAPGHHGPLYHARQAERHDVKLQAGSHAFEYYHAAAGGSAMMVAACEVDPGAKPKRPAMIPSEMFRADAVFHVLAGNVVLRTTKLVPDFVAKIVGDVPLPDDDVPLVGVVFHNTSPKSLTTQGAKLHWDFGDGQTSEQSNPSHVYLRPGLYTVTLAARHGSTPVEMANKLYIDRPLLTMQDKLHSLDNYLSTIERYDPKTLDAASLRQLVIALEAESLALQTQADEAVRKAQAADADSEPRPDAKKKSPQIKKTAPPEGESAEARRYLEAAVAAGKAGFAKDSQVRGELDLLRLAELVGPMARQRLGDSETAMLAWRVAGERTVASEPKAECQIAAADIAINDLLQFTTAKALLDAAAKALGKAKSGPAAANFQRVLGDYCAATGDGKSAAKAYAESQRLATANRRFIEKTAWQGAHTRSTEEFIKQGQFARAAEELQAWRKEFPIERLDGYLTLLYARYWAGRGKYAQAVAQAEQLLTANPDSPYVDQILLLSADCDIRLGRKQRAIATLHALVKDYPGSPWVSQAKQTIATLQGEAKGGK